MSELGKVGRVVKKLPTQSILSIELGKGGRLVTEL